MSSSPKTLAAVFDYPNNHATITLEQLAADRADIKVKFYYWNDFPAFRRHNDWKIPAGATHLSIRRPWKLIRSFGRIRRSDSVYFQSFSSPRLWMALLLLGVIWLGRCRRIFLASEGMKKKPKQLTALIISTLFNSRQIIHLGIGYRSGQDFYDAGMKRWSFRKYCFCERYPSLTLAERPPPSLPLKILSIGQLIERKNHSMLLQAIAALDEPTAVVARIAGDGPLEEKLKQEADHLGIGGQVQLLGFCRHERLHDELLAADLFVLLSRYDGWGVVVGHALNYGLPIIVAKGVRAGRDFLVEPDRNGFVCRSTEELSEQLASITSAPSRLSSMRKESLRKARLWNIATTSARLGQLIDDVHVSFTSGPLSPAHIVKE